MGKYSHGDLNYKCKIEIDFADLVEKIISKIGVSDEDWYFDDTNLVIEAWDKCRYKHWHCDATYYDPPEDDTELIDSIDGKDLEKAIADALDEYKEYISHHTVTEVEIDEESFEYEADEPDPDIAYERWRDRDLD